MEVEAEGCRDCLAPHNPDWHCSNLGAPDPEL